jgi:ribonuclease BN (tRNA processing enzyme)
MERWATKRFFFFFFFFFFCFQAMVFDVGEGTQHQLMRSQSIRQGKIRRLLVTHLHGDHLFGLPGLVTGLCGVRKDVARGDETREPREAPDKLRIYGPRGIREFLACALRVSSMKIPRDFFVHELVQTVEEANEILNVRDVLFLFPFFFFFFFLRVLVEVVCICMTRVSLLATQLSLQLLMRTGI